MKRLLGTLLILLLLGVGFVLLNRPEGVPPELAAVGIYILELKSKRVPGFVPRRSLCVSILERVLANTYWPINHDHV